MLCCGIAVAAIAVIAGLRCEESIKGVLRCVVLYLTIAALASGGERVAVKWEWAQHKLSNFYCKNRMKFTQRGQAHKSHLASSKVPTEDLLR